MHINYHEFIDNNYEPLDLLDTVEGYIKVEDIVIEGVTGYQGEYDEDSIDGDTGVLFENEEGEIQFMSHIYILNLESEGF